ncbi:MAG: hypothetical protein IJY82_04385 [Oscillospiraceae bacterium]|nr:hypothetical protein [Oscillospiraceae bacterium]
MNRFIGALPFKIAVYVLFFLSLLFSVGMAAGSLYLGGKSFYDKPYSLLEAETISSASYQYAKEALFEYHRELSHGTMDSHTKKSWEQYFSPNNTSFRFAIRDEAGAVLLTNLPQGENPEFPADVTLSDDTYIHTEDDGTITVTSVHLTGYAQSPFGRDDRYTRYLQTAEFLFTFRYLWPVLAVVFLLLGVISFVLLMISAGRRRGVEGTVLSKIDRIPLELFLTLFGVCPLAIILLVGGILRPYYMGAVVAAVAGGILLLPFLCMSIAARIKSGGWWKNTLIYRAGRTVLRAAGYLLRGIPFLWRALLFYFSESLAEAVFIVVATDGVTPGWLFLWLFSRVLFLFLILLYGAGIGRLRKAGRRISSGEISYRTDTAFLPSPLKEMANDLNKIGTGLDHAVNERIKSERFRTELITNVSHDIKTPLTSIISYIDLLKNTRQTDPDAAEYIAVLDRQSARLRKLIDDLMEVSKATTGNLSVECVPLNVSILLEQAAGEYVDRLQKQGLATVLTVPQEPAVISADGRLLWRIFDNLLSNIQKYSLPGTRAYISAEQNERQVRILFRNTSSEPPEVTGEELTERFVRGDVSRSSEGNGLGLSIAKSLTELQGGNFLVFVDGDLFKVILTFPKESHA